MATLLAVLDKFISDSVCLKMTFCAMLLVQSKCQTPSLDGPTSGVLGSSVHLLCTLPGSSATIGILPFKRAGVVGSQCDVNTATCSQFSRGTNYSCACVSGETREFYLNISSLSLQDDDTWSCSYNSVSSNSHRLSVYYAPKINSSFPNNKDVTENSSPNIDCSSSLTAGKPSDTNYTWTGPGGYSKSGSVLDRRVSRSQGGSYTCTVRNSIGFASAQVIINVQYAPEISSSFPNNKDVTENSSPNIDCRSGLTAGKPSDTSYTWTGPGGYSKSGSVLDRRVSRSQGGSYTCTARNSAGLSDSAQVNINVQYAPVISSTFPNNKNVTENSNPNIDCSSGLTAGNPSDTSYTWTGPEGYSKSGSVLDRRVSRSQGGSYTCTALNSAGLSDSAQVIINVQYAPKINSSFPNNKDVIENSSPNIDCSSGLTAGNPSDTSYTWTGPGDYSKSGSVLDRRVSRSQRGSYTCTARNSAGLSDTAQVNINVQYAPVISSSFPNNKDVIENSNINIDCSSGLTAGNPSDTSYTWTGPEGYSKSGSVLDRRFSRSQGGSYTCTARNSAGLEDSAQVIINVQYAPEISSSFHNNKDVTENSSPNIDCSSDLTAGNPSDTSYTWTGPEGYSKSGSVLDRSVNRSQGGSYTCTARNSAGLSDSAQVIINVQYIDAPALTISPAEVMENASVHLECKVSSNPTVEMTISNLDNKTDLVDSEMTNTRQLDIDRAQCLHNGTFQCVVNNRALSKSETITQELSVLCLPRSDIRKNSSITVATEFNETAQLVAEVIANPSPNFTWYRLEGEDLASIRNSTIFVIQSSERKSVLQINVTSSKDYGQYAVKVQNKIGESLLKYLLTAKAAPFLPTDFRKTIVGPKFIGVEWTSNFNGGAPQTFYLEYQSDGRWKNVSADGITDPGRDKVVAYNLTKDLKPDTKYSFQLYTTNIYGTSTKLPLEVTTSREAGGLNVAAIAGGIAAGLLVIIVVAGVCILYKRGLCRCWCCSEEKRNGNVSREDLVMQENDLYGRSPRQNNSDLVMEENVCYASSGEVTGASGGATGGVSDVYAVVDKKPKPAEVPADLYAQVKPKKAAKPVDKKKEKDSKGKKEKKKTSKDDKTPLTKQKKTARGDVYENTSPGQFLADADADANTYANAGFIGDGVAAEQSPEPPTGRDADGCLYVGIDFGNQKPGKVVIGEQRGPYSEIAFGRVGPPPPPDSDEEEKKKDTASK